MVHTGNLFADAVIAFDRDTVSPSRSTERARVPARKKAVPPGALRHLPDVCRE